MNGKTSQKERINRAYHITRKATEIKKEDTDKIEAMLYAMADKFLDAVDLEKLKEEIAEDLEQSQETIKELAKML